MSILLESGSFVLEEDGASKVLLESGSGGGGGGNGITTDHHYLGTNRIRGVAVKLTGTGTSWTGSTAFTLSGVSGCSILTKIVNSSTWAVLLIATGGAGGTLTISDGTNSVSLTVKPLHRTRWIPGLDRR